MIRGLHTDAAENEGFVFVLCLLLMVKLVGFFDDWLIGVKFMELCQCGVDGEEKFDAVEPRRRVLLASSISTADVVTGKGLEVVKGQSEIGEFVRLLGHYLI